MKKTKTWFAFWVAAAALVAPEAMGAHVWEKQELTFTATRSFTNAHGAKPRNKRIHCAGVFCDPPQITMPSNRRMGLRSLSWAIPGGRWAQTDSAGMRTIRNSRLAQRQGLRTMFATARRKVTTGLT